MDFERETGTKAIVAFLTRTPDGARRTSGLVVLAAKDENPEIIAAQVAHLARRVPADVTGKVAVVIEDTVHVFQVQPNGTFARCFCGNAICGAAEVTGNHTFNVIGDSDREVEAIIGLNEQRWIVGGALKRPPSFETPLGPVWYVHTFNDYLAALGTEVVPMPRSSGNGKALALSKAPEGLPLVTFFTAGGIPRKAAPLTGLAELRVLAALEPEFAFLEQHGQVLLPGGDVERLPDLVVGKTTFEFGFPVRTVELIDLRDFEGAPA